MAPARYPRTRLAPMPTPALTTLAIRAYTPPPKLPLMVQERVSSRKPLRTFSTLTPQPRSPSTNDMHLLREYNKKYLGYADYDPTAASLGKSFYNNYLLLTAIANDICTNDSTKTLRGVPPSANALLQGTFGRHQQKPCIPPTSVLRNCIHHDIEVGVL